jgi:hypothetical protein
VTVARENCDILSIVELLQIEWTEVTKKGSESDGCSTAAIRCCHAVGEGGTAMTSAKRQDAGGQQVRDNNRGETIRDRYNVKGVQCKVDARSK